MSPPRAAAPGEPAPGARASDPSNPTTALHQRYHDETIEFTIQHFDDVKAGKYCVDRMLTPERQADIAEEARERLRRWPRLSPRDMQRVRFGLGPQRFCPGGAAVPGDPGEHVFVVSLPRRPSRLRHGLGQLRGAGLSATIVKAVDGDALDTQGDLAEMGLRVLPGYGGGHKNHSIRFTTGEVGCFASHCAIWHHMAERGIPAALVLEDDFDLQDSFRERLGECLREVQGEAWDLMYVGRSPVEDDVRRLTAHVKEPGYTLWTVAYILKLAGARALLDARAERHMIPLDDYFSVAMGRGLDGAYNDRAREFSRYIRPIFRGRACALEPPLVMPYVGSMFESDTAMLRKRTRYVEDLPAGGCPDDRHEPPPGAHRPGDWGLPSGCWDVNSHDGCPDDRHEPPPRAHRPGDWGLPPGCWDVNSHDG